MNQQTHMIKVIPRAKKTESVGFMDDGTEKIRIKSIPEDGKANQELLRFLTERDGGKWTILSGATSTKKLLKREES
jgi:uncharacterized protein (TIGR00251 family)